MALQRPAWTILFFAIWGAIAVASLLMHISVGTLVPAITDLPENLRDGILTLFGIGIMGVESTKIMTSTNSALRMCDASLAVGEGVNANQESWCTQAQADCQDSTSAPMQAPGGWGISTQNTKPHVDAILASFDASLAKFVKLSNDKYLGLPEFKEAGRQSEEIRKELDKLIPLSEGRCCGQVASYCLLYELGKGINGLSTTVSEGVNSLSENEGIQTFKEYAGYLNGLHALPYIVVICMLFYTALWYKSGNWCCCSNGAFVPDFCCLILPQMLFWLVSFIVMMIFTIIGYTVSIVFDTTTIDTFPGNPTIQQVIDHISTNFVEFWELSFAALVSGLSFFRTSTTIFFIVALFIFLHSCCFCCCKPYEDPSAEKAEG